MPAPIHISKKIERSFPRPQVHERIIDNDGIPYSIVQVFPKKEFEVWLHKDNNPYNPPDRQSYYSGKITNGYLSVYVNAGLVHRLDGPAVERGNKKDFYINGIQFSEKEFWYYIKDTEHAAVVFANKFGVEELNE
jgi:hypothetical protein